jgi:hypothetical protein
LGDVTRGECTERIGGHLDRVDVGELLKLNRESLDLAYLAGWIIKLGLQRPLRDAWGDASAAEPPPV